MRKTASDDALDRALTDLYQADVPAGYKASWRDAVKREEPSDMKPSPGFSRFRRAALPIAAAAVLVVGTLVTGALSPRTSNTLPSTSGYETAPAAGSVYKTAGVTEDYGYEESADIVFAAEPAIDYAMSPAPAMAEGNGETAVDEDDSRKIVRTVSLTLSSTDFDQDYAAVLSLTESAGGYASSVNIYSQQTDKRTASFELRIPAGSLDGFLSGLEGIGRVTERYETAADMTTQYTDTELRLTTQQDKMTRLHELLLKAETVEDLLYIESEIADTQYGIDRLESALRGIDRQVDYATVSVYLRERTPIDTAVAEELTIGERIANGLKATLNWLGGFFENMFVFLIAAAPVLVPLTAVYIIVRVVRKRRKSNKQH
jgi:hypothetical protein